VCTFFTTALSHLYTSFHHRLRNSRNKHFTYIFLLVFLQLHRTLYTHRSIINWEITETNISPTKICLCVVQLQWHLYAPFNHKLRNSGNEISTYEMLLVSWQLHWTTYTHHSIIIYGTAQNENSTYKTLLVFVQLHWTTYTRHSLIVWETRHNIIDKYMYI
jgi:hypothetical protein